jgi:Rod binding domain-containing protein
MSGLKEIADGFESMVAYQMLQGLRKTVPNFKNGYFGSSFAEGTFRDLLDMELAKSISEQKSLGISEVIMSRYSDYIQVRQ